MDDWKKTNKIQLREYHPCYTIYVNGYQTFTPIYIVKFVTDDYCFLVNLSEKGVLNHFYCFTW